MRSVFLAFACLAAAACGRAQKAPAPGSALDSHSVENAAPLYGDSVQRGAITISEAWAPATPAGGRVAAGYLTVKNSGQVADVLLTVSSSRAKVVELHEMSEENSMVTMRAVPQLAIKGGEAVAFGPGQMHLMLIDPALPYSDGEFVPLTLTFQRAGKIDVKLLVRQRILDGTSGAMQHDGH